MGNVETKQTDILATLRDLQHHQPFADFTVQLREGPVRVSRIVLAAISPVFRQLARERAPCRDFHTLHLAHLPLEAWTCILRFHLGGGAAAALRLDHVAHVLQVCEWFQLDQLRLHCCRFLASRCSSSSSCTLDESLQVRRIARLFGLDQLAQQALQVFSSKLQAGCSPEAFLCLDKRELLELLEAGEVESSEDDLCRALLAWMRTKEADAHTCTELLRYVDVREVTDACLTEHALCHDVTSRTPALLALLLQEVKRRLWCTPRQLQAVPRSSHIHFTLGSLLVVGTDTSDKVCPLLWSYSDKTWISLPESDSTKITMYSAAIVEDIVLATSAGQGKETLVFDMTTRSWTTTSSLQSHRIHHSMTTIGDKVYVVGGMTQKTSIEEYSQASGQWSHIGDLQVGTCCCGVTALGDTILVVGGHSDESKQLIQTFNVETRTAAVLDVSLPRPMHHVRATKLGITAFFVGNKGDLAQVREVDGTFQMVSYTLLQEFPTGRMWYGLHVSDNCLRMIGGSRSQSVMCWNLHGEKIENDDVADLPKGLDVFAVDEVDVFS